MNGYKAFYKGKDIDVYANSLYEAKQKAIEELKPPRSKEHMISVVLCEKDGEQVIHLPLD